MSFLKNEFSNLQTAFYLRIGMGIVFIVGGYNKLSQLLDPQRTEAIVNSYTGTLGYINEFFLQFLFTDIAFFTPWGFLTALSSFELISGIALVAGFMVRPLALIYGFLLWTFVFSLPVVTTPGVELSVKTYTSPAMFVQMRDIALSGLMFVLYQLGSGQFSVDNKLLKNEVTSTDESWNSLGLLLRLSIAAPLVIGGLFGSFEKISTFATPQFLLFIVGVLFILGVQVRLAAVVFAGILLWYMFYKLNLDKSLIANLNAFKREFAFFAASIVVFFRGAGNAYTPNDIVNRIANAFGWSGKTVES